MSDPTPLSELPGERPSPATFAILERFAKEHPELRLGFAPGTGGVDIDLVVAVYDNALRDARRTADTAPGDEVEAVAAKLERLARDINPKGGGAAWSALMDAAIAIRALRRIPSRAGVVGVRDLEWQIHPLGKDEFADSICGRYEVGIVGGAYIATVRVMRNGQWDDDVIQRGICSKKDALAAAQADFATRILSALVPAEPATELVDAEWKRQAHILRDRVQELEEIIGKQSLAAPAEPATAGSGVVAIPRAWFDILGDQSKRNTAEWWSALESLQQKRVDMLEGAAPQPASEGTKSNYPEFPDGWVLVPREPTEEMLTAWAAEAERQHFALDDFSEPIYPAKLYTAMLAAAPSPPVTEDRGGVTDAELHEASEALEGYIDTFADEDAGAMLARLGSDGTKWAAEFRATALRLGYSDMDEGWLIGWFANAIENAVATHPEVKRLRAAKGLDNHRTLDTQGDEDGR